MPAPILPLIEAVTHWPERGALLGLDLGTKTIGVATPTPTAGSPPASRPSPQDLHRRCGAAAGAGGRTQARRLRARPADQHGRQRGAARAIDPRLRAQLARLTELPIALWDERLSTAAVERELIGGRRQPRKRAAVIDQHAAIFILQGALDRLI